MRKLLCLFVVLLLTATLLFAEGTHTWQQSTYEELEQGTARGVAIRSQGGLELAPAFEPLFTTPSTYIWAIADDGQGTVYAAAGSPARVYRVTPQGEASIVFQPSELQVQALVVGRDGAIYAATSPDGKVYKIERTTPAPPATGSGSRASRNQQRSLPQAAQNPSADSGSNNQDESHAVPVDPNYKATVLFEPETKYIWDLALDAQGQLYVATGDRGEIFRVPNNGQAPSLFFKSDEAHIRVLAFDPNGNLIAGSDGSGLVYRISPAGEGFVLYSASKKEITALALDSNGNIYAAAVGEKRAGAPGMMKTPQALPTTSTTITVTAGGAGGVTTQQSVPQVAPPPVLPMQVVTGGSDVYRIAPDGSPKQLWTSNTDVVYALAFDQDRLIIGTGNTGRIYAVHSNGNSTDLVKASANHVSALTRAASGGLYAGTSNLGKLFRLRAVPDAEGSYESDVFDARIFSRWGRAEVRGAGHFDLYARSGNVDNPDRNWSPWQKIDFGANEGKLNVPPARFVQWRAVLFAGTPAPVVDSVTLNYLPKNVAPEISDIAVQPGARFQPTTRSATESITINVGQQNHSNNSNQRSFQGNATAIRDRDYVAVRWAASDANDDSLVYSLYYRGEKETHWKLLAEKIEENQFSFEAALLPDGGYEIMVVASDAASHSPDEALTASTISSHFEVDTTPPQVQNLNAVIDGSSVRVGFRAVDGFSPLQRAEYSIDAGPWQYLEPVGGLSDFRVQEYSFSAPLPSGSVAQRPPSSSGMANAAAQLVQEHVIVVRVYDRFENMSSAKVTVRK